MSSLSGLPTPPLLKGELFEDYLQDFPLKASDGVKLGLVDLSSCRSAQYERKMGQTELSYYLPSRQSGVNDMYLHLGFRAPGQFVRRERVSAVWAILRLRHPLMCARVEMHGYDDVRFVYDAPLSPEDAFADADANLEYRRQSKDELIDAYLNGSRTLSDSRLSYLIISVPKEDVAMPTPPRTPSPSRTAREIAVPPEDEAERQFELLICAMHFLGDGMALHQFANDFFSLLGSEKSDVELNAVLAQEWQNRWGNTDQDNVLPPALEDNMPLPDVGFRRAAANVDFQLSQQKLVGGQGFPRKKTPNNCKAHGVSISAALFAISNIAWARVGGGTKELPAIMYSALNLRPYFTVKRPSPWDSYWFLAIGYFNVILPNFLPSEGSAESAFWHRARQAKEQSARAAKHPLEDDEREKGTWVPPAHSSEPPKESILPARAKVSTAALIGLSLLGNLDGIYKHGAFPAIQLHTLTTGSRQRHGAMLLFGYTFKGKLWISLGYDQNGFADGVVEKFWKESLDCVEEFLG
ncbi:hypothetical protein A0H81_01213 [Grifola frondosa]|uniref:Uncharacterized protein n=1 Tax=Grifola frondosa TaxID=5627 RepID=A0A1C7MPB3_GRIFR|nr:hypothetical protein A0H81_01213 [Grifola frondosa]